MNNKIQCLINGGFISIKDILEYANSYMVELDRFCDPEPEYQMTQEEIDYENQRKLEEYDNFVYESDYEPIWTDGPERSSDPQYIVASVSYRMEETYVFEANEKGEILNFGEYGGLAKRWGNEDWTDYEQAVDNTFGPDKYEYVSKNVIDDGLTHYLFKKIDVYEPEYPLPGDSYDQGMIQEP